MGIPKRSPASRKIVEEMVNGVCNDPVLVADYILWARHEVMVHSCIYYQLDDCVIPDYQWDMLAKNLGDIQDNYPDISEQINYYADYFVDFNGATGCHFPHADFITEATVRSM